MIETNPNNNQAETGIRLSAVIITFNELGYIERCIDSVRFADEIIVVDSFSTDGTWEFLNNHSEVQAIQHSFENFTEQKTFALSQTSGEWILFLDADEIIPENLQTEIIETVSGSTSKVAFWVYRRFMFENKRLYFSGWQTDKNYRLFRKSKVSFDPNKLVHETLNIKGEAGTLKNVLVHYSYKNYADYKSKMLQYGRLRAREDFKKNKSFPKVLIAVKPIWKFLNHYIIRLGILDGKKGIIICYLNALGVYERFRELKRLKSN